MRTTTSNITLRFVLATLIFFISPASVKALDRAELEFKEGEINGVNAGITSPKHPKVTLNRLDALTDIVLPELADLYGLDDLVDESEQIFHDVFKIHDPVQNKDIKCMEVTITYETLVSVPVVAGDVQAEWTDQEQLQTEWDVDSTFSANLAVNVQDLDGNFGVLGLGGGNFFCDVTWEFVETVLGGTGNHVYAVTAGDFSGELDVTLADLGGKVGIGSIDYVSLTFEDFFTLGDITAVYDADCDSTEECLLSEVIDPYVNDIEDVINDSLDYSLAAKGDISVGGADIDYDLSLADFHSHADTNAFVMSSELDLIPGTIDACAAGMTQKTYFASELTPTENDVDVEVPFGLVSDVVYQTGQSGLFCQSVAEELDGSLFLPAGVPAPVTTLSLSGDIEPDGALDIHKADAGEEAVLVLLTGQDVNPLEITIPVAVRNMTVEGAALDDPTQELTANVKMQGFFVLNCAQGLELYVYDVDVADLSGEITYGGFTQDASLLQGAVENAASVMLQKIGQVFPIIPKVNALKDETTLAIELVTIDADDNGAIVGFDVIEDDGECTDWSTLDEEEEYSQACIDSCATACVVNNVCDVAIFNECLETCELTDGPALQKRPFDGELLQGVTGRTDILSNVTGNSCSESCAEESCTGLVCVDSVFEDCMAECEGGSKTIRWDGGNVMLNNIAGQNAGSVERKFDFQSSSAVFENTKTEIKIGQTLPNNL